MNLGKAIQSQARDVLKKLEAIPADKRTSMYDLAVDAAKQAIALAPRNHMAASVQLAEAQCELDDAGIL